jgi:mono/diheme cytochrome c family protein
MKIAGLEISRMNGRFVGLASILSLLLVTAVYAGQTRGAAAPAAKPAAAAAKASPESIANGGTLFKRKCQVCHGATGVGDGPAAKTLKGKLPSLADKDTMAKMTDAQIHDQIVAGKKSEIGNMPAFEKNTTPEEIQDIMNFVRTLAK